MAWLLGPANLVGHSCGPKGPPKPWKHHSGSQLQRLRFVYRLVQPTVSVGATHQQHSRLRRVLVHGLQQIQRPVEVYLVEFVDRSPGWTGEARQVIDLIRLNL